MEEMKIMWFNIKNFILHSGTSVVFIKTTNKD